MLMMSSNNESRFHFRVFAVNLVLSGFSAAEIGKMAGVSKVAVTSWVKAVDEYGFDALRPKGRSGRPSKLTEEQLKEIAEIKLPDLNAYTVEEAIKIVSGTAKNMGIEIKD